MATVNHKAGVVIDFAKAKRKILRKRAAAARAVQQSCNPFEAPLLKAWAATQDGLTVAVYRDAVATGYASSSTTQSIIASVRRDMVRQAARAAL